MFAAKSPDQPPNKNEAQLIVKGRQISVTKNIYLDFFWREIKGNSRHLNKDISKYSLYFCHILILSGLKFPPPPLFF